MRSFPSCEIFRGVDDTGTGLCRDGHRSIATGQPRYGHTDFMYSPSRDRSEPSRLSGNRPRTPPLATETWRGVFVGRSLRRSLRRGVLGFGVSYIGPHPPGAGRGAHVRGNPSSSRRAATTCSPGSCEAAWPGRGLLHTFRARSLTACAGGSRPAEFSQPRNHAGGDAVALGDRGKSLASSTTYGA